MSKIKIVSVSFENFKGFEKKQLDFGQYQAIIVSGKNGFGKTTVFDAIELVFTGKIKRYESYLNFHRQNTALSPYTLPLVFNRNTPQVSVSVKLQVNGKTIVLYRKEKTLNISNPIRFDKVFNELKVLYQKDGVLVDDVYNGQFGLDDFMTSYCFLNYVSQEEATSFLKSKESDRAEQINELFNTTNIDAQIKKIDQIEKKLKEANKGYQTQITDLNNDLSAMDKGEDRIDEEYVRLVSNKEINWDKESPQLSFEEFNSILKDNGILAQLAYFCIHHDEYMKREYNKQIDKIQASPLYPNLPYYLYLSNQQNKYNIYDSFKTKLLPAINGVTAEKTEDTISPLLQSCFKDEIDIDFQKDIQSKFRALQPIGRSASQLGKALTDLQNECGRLKSVFDKNYKELNMTKCPLCGHEYEDNEILKSKIHEYEHVLSKAYPEIQEGLGNMMKELRGLLDNLINVLKTKFENWGITEDYYAKFKEIDFEAYKPYLIEMRKFADVELVDGESVEYYSTLVKQKLAEARKETEVSLDYLSMDKTYTTLSKYMSEEDLTVEKIDKKRNYLSYLWNATKSNLYKNKEKQKKIIESKKSFCDQKIKELNALMSELKKYRANYLGKVISDIEILFYVYSGRIMQDNFYGRGLFIKNETSLKRVLFVSDFKSDVDALYNLSSGQLVAVVFAFLLALNKLYSSQPFIAIDDPVQTIDDINVWGFMETIRHAFNDSFILLSTHEDEYASLLRYKFDKIGISAKCIDMSEVRIPQDVEQ